MEARLLAVSDLHVRYPENREIVAAMRPGSAADWLLVAGDVAERVADIEWALGTLRQRFATVIWVPGNHELWTRRSDPVQLRGEQRYQHLVQVCRGLGVLTPEDPYPVWDGPGGPARIVPLFLLYDYSFHPAGTDTQSGRAGPRLPGRRGVHRRVAALPRPLSEPGGVVLGPGRGHRPAAGWPAARAARGAGEPLPADP